MRLFLQVWSSLHPIPDVTTTLYAIGMVNFALHQAKTRVFMGGKSIGRCSPPNKVTKSSWIEERSENRPENAVFRAKNTFRKTY